MECNLSFTCEKDQKAFYRIMKDCLYLITGEYKIFHTLFTERTSIKLKKISTNLIKVNAEMNAEVNDESMDPLEIKSEYHTANYTTKIHDTWMFTNSTEVTLHYRIIR